MVRILGDFASKGLAIAAIAALGACQAADGTTQAPDTALVQSLMSGLGAVDPNAQSIDYKPRAPLAMPAQNGQLPAPAAQTAGTNAENWPTQANNEELDRLREQFAVEYDQDGNPVQRTPQQMRGFRIVGGNAGPTEEERERARRNIELLHGDTYTAEEFAASKDRYEQFTVNKSEETAEEALQRKYLIDPPIAYNTPSPNAEMPSVVDTRNNRRSGFDDMSEKVDMRCLGNPDTPGCN